MKASNRLFASAVILCGATCIAHAQQWAPSRPINLIVPWAAGGSTQDERKPEAAE